MTTIREVVDGSLADVYGQAQTVDATTFLEQPMATTDLSAKVLDASLFSRGLVQIDDELMLVSGVDRANGNLSLQYPTARAVRATPLVDHPIGALVTMAPSIPRFRVVAAVGETLRSSNGLFRVDSLEFPFVAARRAYPMPEAIEDILSITWLPTGPELDWVPMRRWTWDRHNGDLVLGDDITAGRPVKVAYSAIPTMPDDQDADFAETGLPPSCVDVIRLGAAWRVVSFLEPFNLLPRSAEAEAMDRAKTPQSRLRVAQYLYQMYTERLAQEVKTLQNRYPIRQHFAGRY